MAGLAGLIFLLYIVLFGFTIWLAVRFVRAHERIATALERQFLPPQER